MKIDFLEAGNCGDNCGCTTHEDRYNFGKINLDFLEAGNCSNGCSGCYAINEILMA